VTQNEDELTVDQLLRELLCERARTRRTALPESFAWHEWVPAVELGPRAGCNDTDWAWPRAAELDQALADFSQALKKQAL
jgi:hypothetical protein